jgi:hypothetical protein
MKVRGQLHAPTGSSQVKKAPSAVGQKAEWAPEPVRTVGKKPFLPMPASKSRFLSRLGRSLVAAPTELSYFRSNV